MDEDCTLLWEWVNDSEVRASAFHSDPIPWEKHVAWFRRKRVDPNCYIYILVNQDDHPVGQVRFEIQADGSAEVDIALARHQRGHGYGVKALRLACEQLRKSATVTQIVAYIKPQNVASIRAFERAGFLHRGKEWVKGIEAVGMILRREQPFDTADA